MYVYIFLLFNTLWAIKTTNRKTYPHSLSHPIDTESEALIIFLQDKRVRTVFLAQQKTEVQRDNSWRKKEQHWSTLRHGLLL